ncbi:response regulator transcription factor [Miniphocaeibacter massiliensis]|uniref:response regulator transcription factor n=1 Tax=Miniphocaeibacter massiliensis TaxID=2041841 RepID=UPI000C07C75E|nr:response regulator transcription factor [Miniphocaeibacter massiliensis]
MEKILLVEDDKIMNKMIKKLLESNSYNVISVFDMKDAKNVIEKDSLDLIVLDINLPDGFGLDLAKELQEKNKNLPIMFLTANDLEEDIIKGYKVGAVDYITKPFSNDILILKIKAFFSLINNSKEHNSNIYDNGYLKINFDSLSLKVNGKEVEISPLEFQILKVFVENKNILLTRNKLFELIWDSRENYVKEHTLTAAISRLRKKIETKDRKFIETVYGMGYMFVEGEKNE